MVSVQFCKHYAGPSFCGEWTEKLQTFSRHFFSEWSSKYCLVEFTAIFVSLLLSWSRRNLMKWSSNFHDPVFNNSRPLYLHFSNMINLCSNIWFIENSKCKQFLIWKKNRQEKHIFHVFHVISYWVALLIWISR